MSFDKIKITDIKPAEYNPRKMSNDEYNKLSKSIDEFGLVDPIIINLKNNRIIGGHQRYDVLMEEYVGDNEKYSELFLIKLGDIGWVFPTDELELDDLRKEKALNIALNKISGMWENEQLEHLLIDLDIDGFDVSLTGFDNLDMKNLNFDLRINNKKSADLLREELEKQEVEDKKNIKEYEKKKEKEKIVSKSPSEIDNGEVKKEIVFDGLENENKVDEDKVFVHKCPKCGFEWS